MGILWNFLGILWKFFENSLGILWKFFGNSLGILWDERKCFFQDFGLMEKEGRKEEEFESLEVRASLSHLKMVSVEAACRVAQSKKL